MYRLPTLPPHAKVLDLTPIDEGLTAGIEGVSLPPRDSDEKFLLAHAGIRQAVYLGTHLLASFSEGHVQRTGDLASLMIYRYMLDLGDSIASLLRLGSGSSAFSIIRSLFESSLALDFILEGNRLHSERGIAYYVCHLIALDKALAKQDPSTDSGKRLKQALIDDSVLKKANFSEMDTRAQRKSIYKVLGREEHRVCWDRYKQAKKDRKPSNWYSLCCPAADRRSLAKLLHREGEYEISYSYLSSVSHAEDAFSGHIHYEKESRSIHIHKLRGQERTFKVVANLTANYLMLANRQILDTFLSTDEHIVTLYADWYREYQQCFLWMTRQSSQPGDPG
jgi:hypothetical protein